FDLPTIQALMERFHLAIRPGGLLFLGYSESLFKVYDRFDMVEVEGAFVYQRPRQERIRPTEPAVAGPVAPSGKVSLTPVPVAAGAAVAGNAAARWSPNRSTPVPVSGAVQGGGARAVTPAPGVAVGTPLPPRRPTLELPVVNLESAQS